MRTCIHSLKRRPAGFSRRAALRRNKPHIPRPGCVFGCEYRRLVMLHRRFPGNRQKTVKKLWVFSEKALDFSYIRVV